MILTPAAVAAFAMMETAYLIPASSGLGLTFFVPAPEGFRRALLVPVSRKLNVVGDVKSTRPMGSGVFSRTS
jgi:hypothetical protein